MDDLSAKGKTFPFVDSQSPGMIGKKKKTRYPGFEIFFRHQLPEEGDEQADLSISIEQGSATSVDIKEEELLGKVLADLLISSTAEAETANLGDSFTVTLGSFKLLEGVFNFIILILEIFGAIVSWYWRSTIRFNLVGIVLST